MNWQPIETAPTDGTYFLGIPDGTYKGKFSFIPSVVSFEEGRTIDYEGDPIPVKFWMSLPESPSGSNYPTRHD